MEALQVIAAPRRLRILELVWDRELAAGDIAAEFDVTWSAISQHLTLLREAGLVIERREGTSRLYRADKVALGPLRAVVEDHWRNSLSRIKLLAEAEQREKDRS
jgi:DNA-binding transcriptional ArsR family regulator